MGHTLSTQSSHYNFIGWKTSNDKIFRRFITAEENRIFVNGKRELTAVESKTDKDGDCVCHYVSPGHNIVSVKLCGPKEDDTYGTIIIRDSNNKTFEVAYDVRVGADYEQESETWVQEYTSPGWETSNLAISSIGITLTKQDCTILTNLASSLRPQKRTMQAQGVGFIGWLEDKEYRNYIGMISDTNAWMFFTQTKLLNPKYVKAKYFPPGCVLTAIRVERFNPHSWLSGFGNTETNENGGKTTITMTVMNEQNRTITYVAYQRNVLNVNNIFISVNDNKVIKSIEYLVVPGFSSIEMDFMVIGTPDISDYACPQEVDSHVDTYEEAKINRNVSAQPILVTFTRPEQVMSEKLIDEKPDETKILPTVTPVRVDKMQTEQPIVLTSPISTTSSSPQPVTVTYDFIYTTVGILLFFFFIVIVLYFLYQKYELDFHTRIHEERKKIEASLPSVKSIDELIHELQRSKTT